jgi:Tol biopolymer transport system component
MQLKRQVLSAITSTKIGSQLRVKVKSAVVLALRAQRNLHQCLLTTNDDQNGLSYSAYRLQQGNYPTFFGYFDKTPFSRGNTKILAMVMTSKRDWIVRNKYQPIQIGYFNFSEVAVGSSRFNKLGVTDSWSWQQGCMLQWLPGKAENLVFYNCLVEEQYGSVIQDVTTRQVVRSFSHPLYAISPDGRSGVSLNFSRLERLRPGYGYSNFPDTTVGKVAPNDDGIWWVDLASGQAELLLSLQSLAQYVPLPTMPGATHYVNHLVFSPDGTKLLFLHLWQGDDQKSGTRKNRLLVYDLVAGALSVVEDEAIVSHFSWLSNTEVIATRLSPAEGMRYCIYDIQNRSRRYPQGEERFPHEDGHPSPSPDLNWLVTDTYPDRYGDQHLHLLSLRDDRAFNLGNFYSPPRYRGVVRCDMHPRWDRSGKRICFDSTHNGNRALYVIELGDFNLDGYC